MTAELWAIPAVLLALLLIGLVALMRGRPRTPPPPAPRLGAQTRPMRAPATQPPSRPFDQSYGGDQDTEPDNLNSRREASTEALKLARQRAAADAARLDALRQSRAQAAGQAPRPSVVTPLRRPLPPARAPLPGPAAPAGLPAAVRPVAPLLPVPAPPPVPPSAVPPQPVPPPPAPAAAAAAPMAASALASRAEPPPPARPATPPLPAPLPRPAAQAPVAVAAPMPAAPITVLVVDDSKVVRVKTSRLLEKHHYKVMLADDGLTALQALAEHWPDLVITDVEMPGLDGFGLTQQLRSQPRGQAMPVIMITSSNERHRDEATRAGVSVLLGKPYPEAQLLAEVEKALGRVAQPAPAGLLLQ